MGTMQSDQTKKKYLSSRMEKFLRDFSSAFSETKPQGENETVIAPAWLYEKIRVAVEYQEEHLVFKNAIARILRRTQALSLRENSEQLLSDLINELSWANYLNPENLTPETMVELETIIERYLTLLKSAHSGRFQKHELQHMIIDWLACEMEETLQPAKEDKFVLDWVYEILAPNLDIEGARITPEENEIQLKIAINNLILKPDLPRIQYWLFQTIYPDFNKFSLEEAKKIGRSFDPYFNKIDRALNHPLRKKYLSFVKRNIAPFILIYRLLITKKIDLEIIRDNPASLRSLAMEVYDHSVAEARRRVWRGTFRALIFILITKISLAFFLEVPFDRLISGYVDIISLIINVSLPPLLMLVAGTFVKSPSRKNARLIADSLTSIITADRVDTKVFSLIEKKTPPFFMVFNILYSIFSLAILSGVIWLLLFLNFNIVSIVLFFFFVSVVSFFSFRIRNIALELAMKRSRDDTLTSAFEFIFLPFIRIGKAISERFANFNPFILALDFLIEAPLKTIIKLMNMWLKFINAKKEELE